MAAFTAEYLPFVVLMFVFLSVRLDRATVWNSLSVIAGAFTLFVISPAQSPWGIAVSWMLLVLAVAMTPLGGFLFKTLKLFFLGSTQNLSLTLSPTTSADFGRQIAGETLKNPKLINKLTDPSDAEVE